MIARWNGKIGGGVSVAAAALLAVFAIALLATSTKRQSHTTGDAMTGVLHISAAVIGRNAEGESIYNGTLEAWSDRSGQRLRLRRIDSSGRAMDEAFVSGTYKYQIFGDATGEGAIRSESVSSYHDAAVLIAGVFYEPLVVRDIDWDGVTLEEVNVGPTVTDTGHVYYDGDSQGAYVPLIVNDTTALPVRVDFVSEGEITYEEYSYNAIDVLESSTVADSVFDPTHVATGEVSTRLDVAETQAFDRYPLFYVGETYAGKVIRGTYHFQETGAHAQELIDRAGRGSDTVESVAFMYGDPALDEVTGRAFEIVVRPASGYVPPYDTLPDVQPISIGGVAASLIEVVGSARVWIEREGAHVVIDASTKAVAIDVAEHLVRANPSGYP